MKWKQVKTRKRTWGRTERERAKESKHMSRIWREMKAQTNGLMCRIASFSEVWCEVDDIYTTYYKIIHMYGPTKKGQIHHSNNPEVQGS